MKKTQTRFNIHDFANALLKLPKDATIFFRGIDGESESVKSFGAFMYASEDSIDREEELELIEKGLIPTHYVTINANPETFKFSDYVKL